MGQSSRWPLGFLAPVSRYGVEDVATVRPADSRAPAVGARPLTANALCEAYAGRVFKFAQLVSEDSAAAEDLAQEALERAIRGLKSFEPSKGDVEGWLWRIVVNAGRDAGRIARRRRIVFQLLVDRWLADQKSYDLGELRTEEVLNAVRSLSTRYRAVVALRYGADLTYRDVGRVLGISEAAALMSTKRALNSLRLRLAQGVQSQ
jgi:RNA polymerase sigma-70 factor, ECF subfamily